jgi:hypothetical protein
MMPGRYSLIDEESTYDRRFHEMWTSSVDKPGYVKEAWRRLDGRLERARTKLELDSVLRDASIEMQIDPEDVPSDVAFQAIVRSIKDSFPPGASEDDVRLAIAKSAWMLALKRVKSTSVR